MLILLQSNPLSSPQRFAINMRMIILLGTASVLSACATIDHTASVKQEIGKTLIAGPGDLVLRVERERSLENAFGKADLFGRKTKEGFTELRFGGVEDNGEIVLIRKDFQVITNETTMSRTPIATTTGQSTTSVSGSNNSYGGNTQIQGTGTTNYTSTTLMPPKDYHVVVPSGTVAVRVTPAEKRVPVVGHIIEIVSASRNSLEYKISKQD